jgi:hypothetical protein
VGQPWSGSHRPVRVGERERGRGGPGQSNYFKLDLIQTRLHEGENFEIKYDFEYLKKVNNFFYRNIPRFEMDFELKSR